LEKTDTLYLILDEKANLNKEQDKISKNISFKVPFLRLGESSPIYKIKTKSCQNPYKVLA
jgi:adenine specific DNA methylase Mod